MHSMHCMRYILKASSCLSCSCFSTACLVLCFIVLDCYAFIRDKFLIRKDHKRVDRLQPTGYFSDECCRNAYILIISRVYQIHVHTHTGALIQIFQHFNRLTKEVSLPCLLEMFGNTHIDRSNVHLLFQVEWNEFYYIPLYIFKACFGFPE